MSETEFWTHLEYRLGQELPHGYWCDGIGPGILVEQSHHPHLRGYAFVGQGRSCEEWQFMLRLPTGVPSLQDLDWQSLLPADDCHGWLSLEPKQKQLQLDFRRPMY